MRLQFLMLALLFAGNIHAVSTNIRDSVNEYQLDNGMRILMVQRPGAPMISAGWVAHVGSANEKPGITGISHLFEHMMFKGSPRIGTRDNLLDSQLRGELDDVRTQMFALERKYREQVRLGAAESINDPEIQGEDMLALKEHFQELVEQQRANLVKDEFDQIYTEAGATGQNAGTTQDLTIYFIRVPRNKLELWFWMESERLTQPVFREFYSERDVVYEERRMRTDSTPTGAQDEVFESLLWRGHPYGWPVIGWPSDISAITRKQAEDYFSLYYAPNNITVALVGDFDEVKALEMANAYFGVIPRGKSEPPDVITLTMPLLGDLEYRAEVEAPPSVSIHFRTTAFDGEDDPALQLLNQVLSGKTGRLYKRLVLEDQIATSTGSAADGKKYDGQFVLSASGKSDIAPEQLKAVLLEEIDKIKTDGITDYELQKARNQLKAYMYRRLEDNFGLMIQLLFYDGLRDWTTMDTNDARIALVSKEDVQRVAEKYFTADNRASKLYTRKQSTKPEDPELTLFNDEQKQMISQVMANVAAAPAEAILGVIGQMEQFKEQAPAEQRAAFDYVIKKLRGRLDNEGADL